MPLQNLHVIHLSSTLIIYLISTNSSECRMYSACVVRLGKFQLRTNAMFLSFTNIPYFEIVETADASVVVLPSHDNTTFENNASYVTFTCFGIGAYMYLLWTVNGYDTGSPFVLNKGIRYTPYIISPDGLSVSSQLIVPTTKANNNITVICIVGDLSFNPQFSNPVKLFLQGTVYMYLSMIIVIMISISGYYKYNRTK